MKRCTLCWLFPLFSLSIAWLSTSLLAQAPASPAFEHGKGKLLESAQGRVYVEVEGKGRALLLVGGSEGPGGSHFDFHGGFSRVAAAGHSVVYFDLLGRGRSERIASGQYTVEVDIETIESVRLGLGLDGIDVLGLGYGGIPALGYSLRYPEHVRRLVMCDAAYDAESWQQSCEAFTECLRLQYPEDWERLLAARAGGMRSGDPAHHKLIDRGLVSFYWFDSYNSMSRPGSGNHLDYANDEVNRIMLGADADWELGGTLKGYKLQQDLKQLKVPTLVATGRQDRIFSPFIAWRLKQALPAETSTWVAFERSGHLPFIEEPDAFFERLIAFLETK
jgi:proline iminopeptidase